MERLEITTYMEYMFQNDSNNYKIEDYINEFDKLIETKKYKNANLYYPPALIKFIKEFFDGIYNYESYNLIDFNKKYKNKTLIEYLDSIKINCSYYTNEYNWSDEYIESIIDPLKDLENFIKLIKNN